MRQQIQVYVEINMLASDQRTNSYIYTVKYENVKRNANNTCFQFNNWRYPLFYYGLRIRVIRN